MICQVCEAATDASQLCGRCVCDLATALRALPGLLADLEITATRRDRIGGPGAEADLLPFAWAASDLAWAATNTLTTWARHLAESHPPATPVGPACSRCRHWTCMSVRAAGDPGAFVVEYGGPVAFLVVHLAAIAQDEAAGQLWDEIVSLRRAVGHAIDRRVPGLYAGRCDAYVLQLELVGDTMWPVAVECGTDLYYRRGDVTVRCRACGTVGDVAARRVWLLARVPDQVATAADIASGLATLAREVRAQTIHAWATRGLLPRRGHDPAGHTLFRVGDVVALIDSTARRLARRGVA